MPTQMGMIDKFFGAHTDQVALAISTGDPIILPAIAGYSYIVYQIWAYNLDPTSYKQVHVLADEQGNVVAAHRIGRIAMGALGRTQQITWPGGIPVFALRLDALSGAHSCSYSVLYRKVKDTDKSHQVQAGPAEPATGNQGVRETIITGTNDGQVLPAVANARWLVHRIDAYSQSGTGPIPWTLRNGEADTSPAIMRFNMVAPATNTDGTIHIPFRRPIIVDAMYAERNTATSQQVTFVIAATLLHGGK